MLRNLAFAVIAVVACVAAASSARATPAEIVVVLDTSASMSEPSGGPDGETKLDLARRVATRIVDAAAESRHRVGMLRFRQIDAVVEGGEGPRRVHEEDEEQCVRVADLLVPIAPGGAADVARWTDGIESDENPEVVALGDSPLYGAVRAAIRYLRARRNANPLSSCVNAFVVVITDGRDTCAAGAELENALTELREQSVTEDIRGLVLAFDPDGEAATLLAHLGHPDDGEARPYGPDDADALVQAVSDIEGRLAPEACVESGVAPEAIGLPATPPVGPGTPPPPGSGDDDDDDGGCSAARSSTQARHHRGLTPLVGLAFMVVAVALRSRRRRATQRRSRRRGTLGIVFSLVAVLSSCGDDDGPGPGDGDAAIEGDGGTPPAMLSDPSEAAQLALARLDAILDSAERVRAEHLRPMLEPDRVFDAIEGDPVQGCTELVRSMGYEPYLGAQRGVEGCIATRRCNALDLALVLQACLDSKGTSSELHRCAPDNAFRPQLVSEANRAPVMPDLTASGEALEAAFVDATMAEAPLADDIRSQYPKFVDYMDRDVGDAVDEDVRRLMPHVALDADDADLWADNRAETGARTHYYVDVGGEAIDPVLEGSPVETGRCTGALVELADEAVSVRMQVLVSYADVDPRNTSFAAPVLVAETTWLAYESWGRYATLAIVDAGTRSVPDDVPPAATSGCLRALIQTPDGSTTIGAPFFIATEDASDCPAMMAVEAAPGRHLASVILRTEISVGSEVSSLERVLIDRYGYAFRTDGAHESGPMFSAEAARTLVPMRVDLLVAGGSPGPHKLADVLLEDLIERRDELARNLAATYGVHPDTAAAAPPEQRLRPLAWATLGGFARYAADRLPENAFSLELRPSRMAVVRRRGYGATATGLGVGPQTIFDIVEHPVVVVSPDGDTTERLRANVALGALVTEAERVATTGAEGAFELIHAGAMLRDDATGDWALYGSDDDHSQPQFPLAVLAAHRNRMLNGEDMIVTPGAAPFEGSEYVAWWRVNTRTGHVLGEVRYDGTFYGGVAPVKAIGIYDACLFAASILSLQDGRTIPDQECCFELATRDLLDGIIQSHMWNIAFMAYFTPDAYGWDAGGVVAPTRSLGSVWTLVYGTVDLVMRQRELLNAPEPMCVTEE